MRIIAPVRTATGIWCTVKFTNGVGYTNDPHLIEWFTTHGYTVESEEPIEVKPKTKKKGQTDGTK